MTVDAGPAGPGSPFPRSAEAAALAVRSRDFRAFARVLLDAREAFTAALEARVWGFPVAVLRENDENFGLYFLRQDAPVPFLWLGLAWGADDAPGTPPSWGASVEVNGEHLRAFEEGVGGLAAAFESAAQRSEGRLGVYRFTGHVELAEWRDFSAFADAPDPAEALVAFLAGFLDVLAGAEVPEAMDAFLEARFGGRGRRASRR
jgi:hypothetical protein